MILCSFAIPLVHCFRCHDNEALFLCTCFESDLYWHIAIRVVWIAPREEGLSSIVQSSMSLLRQWMIKVVLQGVSFYHWCSVAWLLNKVLKSFTVTLLCISKILYCLLPEIHPIFTSIKMPHNYQENYLGIIQWAAPCKNVHLYKQKCPWHPTVILIDSLLLLSLNIFKYRHASTVWYCFIIVKPDRCTKSPASIPGEFGYCLYVGEHLLYQMYFHLPMYFEGSYYVRTYRCICFFTLAICI